MNWARNVAHAHDLVLARGKEGTTLSAVWAKRRHQRVGYANTEHPFRLQGSADLNSYKMFTEVFLVLLSQTGRMGIIVPSGLYTDSGTKDLREYFQNRSSWRWLFSFENRRKIFEIDERFKFASVIVDRQMTQQGLQAAFMIRDMAWELVTRPRHTNSRTIFSPTVMR